jgi:hypothetical protein
MKIELTTHQAQELAISLARIINYLDKSPYTADAIGIDTKSRKNLNRINDLIAQQVAAATT